MHQSATALVTGIPRALFAAATIGAGTIDYDVSPDGKRFVVVRTLAAREWHAVFVENWMSRLGR